MRHYRVLALLLTALAATGCASTTGSCPVLTLAAKSPGLPHPEPIESCPRRIEYPFRNLVLEGGGVKGIAYAGAFRALDEQGILDRLGSIAGTSAGAITATLVALRYTPDQIQKLVFNLDFKRFEDGGASGLFRLFERFGWYRGNYVLHLMRCLVGNKAKSPRATFQDLQAEGFRDLHVFSTDLSTGQSVEFSAAKSPNVEVALAVRMSISIPLFFAAVDFKPPGGSQGDVFVDGGVLRNYAIDAFDTRQRINPQTLGLTLTNGPSRRADIDGLPTYAKNLFETLLDVQVIDLETNPPDLERSVLIDDLGISTTDFQLTSEQKNALIRKGFECTCKYLGDWQSWQPPNSRPSASLPGLGRATRIEITRKCGSAFGPG
ncbi:MAG TPA: patatin-like phospholipase family protein [Thermoanaerobaculia bacterium]|nr:patatin-like phospholipase family protein [Thermoanaerobaculia bacterium]